MTSLAQSMGVNVIENAARKAKLAGNCRAKSGSTPAWHKLICVSDVSGARINNTSRRNAYAGNGKVQLFCASKSLSNCLQNGGKNLLATLFCIGRNLLYGLNVWSVGAVKSDYATGNFCAANINGANMCWRNKLRVHGVPSCLEKAVCNKNLLDCLTVLAIKWLNRTRHLVRIKDSHEVKCALECTNASAIALNA